MKEKTNFFTHRKTRKQIIILFGLLFSLQSILSSISYGFSNSKISKVITLFFLWGLVIFLIIKIKKKYLYKKDELINKFEKQKEDIGIIDALIYAILSYKDIFYSIPQDRKQIINISFILIGTAFLFLYLQIGNFFSILSSFIVIISAVLILIRIVTMEREERERLQDELSVARDMQISLMPKEPPIFHNFDIYGMCKPARIVGGDFFDFDIQDENKLIISVADVSGKGLDAAMTTLFISGALASELKHSEDYINIISNLNTITKKHSIKGKFISFLLSVIDYRKRKLYFINAGQPKPILKRDNDVFTLDSNGARLPLGAMNGTKYEITEFDILDNDILFLFTDGVTEAMNIQNELYTSERLSSLIKAKPLLELSANDMFNLLHSDILSFCNGAEQNDDITMTIIKIKFN